MTILLRKSLAVDWRHAAETDRQTPNWESVVRHLIATSVMWDQTVREAEDALALSPWQRVNCFTP